MDDALTPRLARLSNLMNAQLLRAAGVSSAIEFETELQLCAQHLAHYWRRLADFYEKLADESPRTSHPEERGQFLKKAAAARANQKRVEAL